MVFLRLQTSGRNSLWFIYGQVYGGRTRAEIVYDIFMIYLRPWDSDGNSLWLFYGDLGSLELHPNTLMVHDSLSAAPSTKSWSQTGNHQPWTVDLHRNSDPDLPSQKCSQTVLVLPPLSSSDPPKGRDPRPPARLAPRSWGRLVLAVLEWPATARARQWSNTCKTTEHLVST